MNPELLETLALWGIVTIVGLLVIAVKKSRPTEKDDYYNEHDDLFH